MDEFHLSQELKNHPKLKSIMKTSGATYSVIDRETMLNKIQIKIKHILVKLADEESLIASLKGLLRAKKEKVGKVESQQRERVVGGFVQR